MPVGLDSGVEKKEGRLHKTTCVFIAFRLAINIARFTGPTKKLIAALPNVCPCTQELGLLVFRGSGQHGVLLPVACLVL